MIQDQESYTAKLCAFARAWHSNTARQKIFDDYLAYDLMGWEAYETIKKQISSDWTDGTRDDFVRFINQYFAPIPLEQVSVSTVFVAASARRVTSFVARAVVTTVFVA